MKILLLVPLVLLTSTARAACTAAIFNGDRNELITEVPDKEDFCRYNQLLRRVFSEESSSSGARPKLREVKPFGGQSLFCMIGQPCRISISGYGLKVGDFLGVIEENSKCGDLDAFRIRVTEIDNYSIYYIQNADIVMTADNIMRRTVVATFDLPGTANTYKVCYVPKEGINKKIEKNEIDASLLPYEVGSLNVNAHQRYACDFEHGNFSSCGVAIYRPRTDLDFKWHVTSGPSTTPGSGPNKDHTYEHPTTEYEMQTLYNSSRPDPVGHYAIMKSPGYLGSSIPTSFIGPPMLSPSGKYCVSFWYYMYGNDVNTLRAYTLESKLSRTETDASAPTIDSNHWGSLRWSAVGNKGAEWHRGSFTMDFHSDIPNHFLFEALTGNSELADIAIDDIAVFSGECDPALNLNPKSSTEVGNNMICGEVRMTTGNHPEDKSWNVNGAINCSGRGYTRAEAVGNWLPCCVPAFGRYELLLRDSRNDGWENSMLELRFFDRIYTYGTELLHHSGDVSVPIVIGQIEIIDGMYVDSSIIVRVRVVNERSKVYCGIAEVAEDGRPRQPYPTSELLKNYGVEYPEVVMDPNQIVSIEIRGSFVKPDTLYDIYCHSEPMEGTANFYDLVESLNTSEPVRHAPMTNEEIIASRIRMSTDSTPPKIIGGGTTIDAKSVTLDISADGRSKVWCLPIRDEHAGGVSSDIIMSKGEYYEFLTAGDYQMVFNSLPGGYHHTVFCTARDFAEPMPNTTTDEELRAGLKDANGSVIQFNTIEKHPDIAIKKVSNVTNGFDVIVKVDGPGNIYCAAGGPGIDFPQVKDVISVGSKGVVSLDQLDDHMAADVLLQIRGVENNLDYKIFCTATTLDEKLKDKEKNMWKQAVTMRSYGRFCPTSINPKISTKASVGTPFDPISKDEELTVKRYLLESDDWDVDVLYRVNLFMNKTEIYDYYDNDAPLPPRYARVRLGRCVENRGFYEQLKVGPLDASPMTWERLAEPRETSCGGYSSEGVFGRRLAEGSAFFTLQPAFKRLYGAKFDADECSGNYQADSCLRLGSIAIDSAESADSTDDLADDDRIFIGLRRPDSRNTEFYFELSKSDLPQHAALDNKFSIKEVQAVVNEINWPGFDGPVWFAATRYNSISDFLEDIDAVENRIQSSQESFIDPNFEVVGNANVMKLKRRKLAPGPYPGGAGTAGPDLLRTAKRSGLEYKLPPEHIEPAGKRYQITAHPGGESFTIEYAGWKFVVTNDRDKALQLWNLNFLNERILFNVGLQEAMAHYTVAERTWFFMDSWYGGLGGSARPVLRGYECPKTGSLVFYDQSLCVFEREEGRPIRSHYRAGEIRDAAGHYTLNLRQMVTVSNYDYLVTYTFHASGHVESTVAFTGELYAGIEVPWYSSRQAPYGNLVTGAMRMAALHAHLAVWKYDFDIDDYKDNSLFIEEVIPDPNRPGANYIDRYYPDGEVAAAVKVNDPRYVGYSIVSERKKTYGNPAGWRCLPGVSWHPLRLEHELYNGTGAWAKYKVFTTVHRYGEDDATLPRDNKYAGDPAVSIQKYIDDNEPVRHTDLVTWMSMNFMHIPSSEDYPLTIPIGNTLSAMIRPFNWYLEDPTMDLHNAIQGDFRDPGQCAVVRQSIHDAMDTKDLIGPVLL